MKTILLVEDEAPIRRAVEISLQEAGYQVYGAANGLDALKIMKTNIPDLVLTDIRMPYMNGGELVKAMKKDKKLKDIDIVLFTNYSERRDYEEAVEAGNLKPNEDVWIKVYASIIQKPCRPVGPSSTSRSPHVPLSPKLVIVPFSGA